MFTGESESETTGESIAWTQVPAPPPNNRHAKQNMYIQRPWFRSHLLRRIWSSLTREGGRPGLTRTDLRKPGVSLRHTRWTPLGFSSNSRCSDLSRSGGVSVLPPSTRSEHLPQRKLANSGLSLRRASRHCFERGGFLRGGFIILDV